jgi:hypothetical protein
MIHATLTRQEYSNQGTFGVLALGDKMWFSLELPDHINKPNISCIPNGTYLAKLRYSPNFRKNLYCLQKVPNRSFILIHGANFAGDEALGYQTHLQGCISIGKSVGMALNKYKRRQRCILNSQMAMSEFMDVLDGQDFILTIKD